MHKIKRLAFLPNPQIFHTSTHDKKGVEFECHRYIIELANQF